MFENIRKLSKYITGNSKSLEFTIPDIEIKRNDNSQIRDKIMSIDPEKKKKLKINKSTLWYQQKKIKEGKSIKINNKKRLRVEGIKPIVILDKFIDLILRDFSYLNF